jgi:hypothetical protein
MKVATHAAELCYDKIMNMCESYLTKTYSQKSPEQVLVSAHDTQVPPRYQESFPHILGTTFDCLVKLGGKRP